MPQQMWTHTCPGSASPHWMGSPDCHSCGGQGEYDGWHPRMHEAMAQYQTRYRLKPIGPHRRMADELFASVGAKCQACGGRGLVDTLGGRGWLLCKACRGLGATLTKPMEDIEALRQRVLAVHPKAAADPVGNFFSGPVAFSGADQAIVNLSNAGGLPAQPDGDVLDDLSNASTSIGDRHALRERVVSALRQMTEGGGSHNFLVLEADPRRNLFVQFATSCGSATLLGEAVSDRFLETPLRSAQRAQLQRLG